MKQLAISQFRKYSLIGVISCATVLGTGFCLLTQAKDYSTTPGHHSLASGLIWPTQGNITKGFNAYHEGIDIANSTGTPIVAAASGTVIKAGRDDSGWGLGNVIEIQHPDGSHTVYGHNSRLLVSKGQQVTQGQVIAEMGSTGNSTGPHLHFEFHPDGRLAVDPATGLPSLVAGKIPPRQMATAAPKPIAPPPVSQAVRNNAVTRSNNPTYPNLNVYPGGRQQGNALPVPRVIAPQPLQPIVGAATSGVAGTFNQCSNALIEGETASSRVKVCRENGQLFYVGQLKQQPSASMQLAAWRVGQDRYQADNGSYSYFITPRGVEVWRNGRQLRSEPFNGSLKISQF
ncbi:M23 family metallopeptidase [Coleofasciculus sp. FACHB-1120]|uniref:M23 family metallopeptidase n=1 Tax=Coleofasciculus sp. FACHB-1120 TaxID=2692783 RepID=UPI001681E002|nr:M23 family metallopeptidase [Coleofasciculus sp. FACHB-1120]MBD2743034.1 M23 family metallopeptidase [Coleofasciculus sp. FACHB-1120]